jgi:biotin-(acetyl-CoA carboxylase) ligase
MKSIVSAVSPILFLLLVGSVGMGIGCNSEPPTETAAESQKAKAIEVAEKEMIEAATLVSEAMNELQPILETKDLIKIKTQSILTRSDISMAEERLERAERIAVKHDLVELEDKCKLVRDGIESMKKMLSYSGVEI